MNLFFRESGQGPPLVILHGLFGSSDNWFSLSKVFARHFTVFTVDQRNHGLSPHHPEHDYEVLTGDLEDFLSSHAISQPAILGHSMGGKTAMNFAVRNPGKLSKLIVVDIMPKKYPLHHDHILEGLNAVDLQRTTSRAVADRALQAHVPEVDVRQFLLKNLARENQTGFKWKINLPALEANMEALSMGLVFSGEFAGPTLFIKGARSNYFAPGDEKLAADFFPNSQWATVESGHWVQAEKPEEFAKIVLRFLEAA